MKKVAVITDSNSGITQEEAKKLGITVLPMPFFINDELYYEDITLSQEEFYRFLAQNADVKTSQPTPEAVLNLWDKALEAYDEVVYIPMSSGLSSSCETAKMLSQDYEDRVFVVDNQRISWSMKQSVLEALVLAQKGYEGRQIQEILERDGRQASIYITLDTLKYLKKGGRITPAAATFATVLNIKPVLQIQGDKLDAFAKVRGLKQAKKTMLDALEKDLTERFAGQSMYIRGAYTCAEEEGKAWIEEVKARFPGYPVYMDPLSLSVSCHIGPGAVAVLCCRELPETGCVDYQAFAQ